MTNKKFKLAAMSLALSAAVVAAPVVANAEEVEAPAAGADNDNEETVEVATTKETTVVDSNEGKTNDEPAADDEKAETPLTREDTTVEYDEEHKTTTENEDGTVTEKVDGVIKQDEVKAPDEPDAAVETDGEGEEPETEQVEIGTAEKTETKTETEGEVVLDPDSTVLTPDGTQYATEGTQTTHTEVEGEATGEIDKPQTESKDVSEDEQEKVETEISGSIKWDVKEGDKVGDYTVEQVIPAEDCSEDGSKELVAISKTEKKEGALTGEEVEKLVAADDYKDNGDGTYTLTKEVTYTDANGAEQKKQVNIVIDTATGTTTTKTTYFVEVSKADKDIEVEHTEDYELSKDYTVSGNTYHKEYELDLSEALKDKNLEESGTYEVKQGDVTFTITVTPGYIPDGPANLSNDELVKLLNADNKQGGTFSVEGDQFYYTTEKGEKCALSVDASELLKKGVNISVTVSDPHAVMSGEALSDSDKNESAAKDEAQKEAILAAVKKAYGKEVPEGATINDSTVTFTADGKTYTYSFSVSDNGGVKVEDETVDSSKAPADADVAETGTYTYTGTAYVTGSTVVWSESGSYSSVATDSVVRGLGADYKTAPEGAVESSIKRDASGRITEYKTADGKTYTFSYGAATVTDEDLKAYITAQGGSVADLDKFTKESFTKVTWTIKAPDTTTDVKDTTMEGDASVREYTITEKEDGTYTVTYKKDGKNVTIDGVTKVDGKYTKTDGNTVYTFAEEPVRISADTIKQQLATKYGVKASDITLTTADGTDGTDGGALTKATFTKDGKDYTVDYTSNNTKLNITTTTTTTTTDSHTETSEKAYLAWVRNQITDAESKGETIKIDGHVVTSTTTDEVLVQYASSLVKFDELTSTQLVALLEGLKGTAEKNNDLYYTGFNGYSNKTDHTDLDVAGKVEDVTDSTKNYGATVLRDGLSFEVSTDANALVNGNGTDIASTLSSSITYDQAGHYEYQHNTGNNNRPGYGYGYQTSKVSNSIAVNQYYKVTGTVAFDLSDTAYSQDEANQQVNALKQAGCENATAVKVGNEYKVYKNTATLTAYGVMTRSANDCRNKGGVRTQNPGYDLLLDQLYLANGKVYGYNSSTTTYTANVTRTKTTTTTAANTNKVLNVTNATYKQTVEGEKKNGSDIYGTYTANYEQVNNYTKTEGSETTDGVKGTGTGSYDYYKTWLGDTGSNVGGVWNKIVGKVTGTYKTTEEVTVDVQEVKTEETSAEGTVTYHYGYDVTDPVTVYTDVPGEDDPEDDEPEIVIPPAVVVTPPVQDATPDIDVPVAETIVTPEEPELPAVQDATPDAVAAALPQTGVNWTAALAMAFSGIALTVAGAFASLTYKEKH